MVDETRPRIPVRRFSFPQHLSVLSHGDPALQAGDRFRGRDGHLPDRLAHGPGLDVVVIPAFPSGYPSPRRETRSIQTACRSNSVHRSSSTRSASVQTPLTCDWMSIGIVSADPVQGLESSTASMRPSPGLGLHVSHGLQCGILHRRSGHPVAGGRRDLPDRRSAIRPRREAGTSPGIAVQPQETHEPRRRPDRAAWPSPCCWACPSFCSAPWATSPMSESCSRVCSCRWPSSWPPSSPSCSSAPWPG